MADLTHLTGIQQSILKIMAATTSISYQDVAAQLAISELLVLKEINALKAEGFLRRVGRTQGHWEVVGS